MELPAVLINRNSAIEGWSVAGITEKFSLYADNMLVYLDDLKTSLESLLDTVDVFGLYSGVNWAKSALYPVSDASETEISHKSNLIVVDRFTYLA